MLKKCILGWLLLLGTIGFAGSVDSMTANREAIASQMKVDQQQPQPDTAQQASHTRQQLIKLIVIIGLLAWIVYRMSRLMRHQGVGRFSKKSLSKSELKILETKPLGPKQCLYIIECEGQRMLIGVTAQSMHYLCALSAQKDAVSAYDEEAFRKTVLNP